MGQEKPIREGEEEEGVACVDVHGLRDVWEGPWEWSLLYYLVVATTCRHLQGSGIRAVSAINVFPF